MDEPSFRHSSLIARDLRNDGLVVELAAAGKLKRSMELASKLNARYALLVGEQEVANRQYSLKNMATGEQISVPKEDLKKHICQTL
jgi:histidyl-tRNA synthetase